MDECNKIYKEYHFDRKTINELATKYNRSWATIKKIVTSSPDKKYGRSYGRKRESIVITPDVVSEIDYFLRREIDLHLKRKEKYSSQFIYKNLLDRQLYSGSFRTLRRYISITRKKLYKRPAKVFVQLEFEFGDYLQVDHGPLSLSLNGEKIHGYLFVASVPGQVLRFCQFYPTKASEAWGSFHERAFNFFGGIFKHIIYDNDTVLKNPKTGKPTKFTLEMQGHYGLTPVFCNKASGWEKGAVENAVGFCRRNYLPALQEFSSLEVVNDYLLKKCEEEIQNGHHYENKKPLVQLFHEVREKLWPLKNERSWDIIREAKVSSFQTVTYKGIRYSTPEKFVGGQVQLAISADKVKVAFNNENVATHDRKFIKGDDSILLDHYLDILQKRPGAFYHSKVVKMAKFSAALNEIKERLMLKMSPSKAIKDFIEILKIKRTCTEEEFNIALDLGLEIGGITSEAIKAIVKYLQKGDENIFKEIESEHIKIDHHFDLLKYQQLEVRSFCG